MKKKEITSISDIKQSKWKDLLSHIAAHKLTLVIGDDLVNINGESLNKFLSRKLFSHTLELLKDIYEGEHEKFNTWVYQEYNIDILSETKDYFSFEILKLYDDNDCEYGSVDSFIRKEIEKISTSDVDISEFRRLLDETEPRIIVSTCYCSLLLNEFIDYAIKNNLKPYVGEILGGDSSGGFTIYGREYNQGKFIWKGGNVWEGKKGEVIYLTIGGDFDPRDNSIYNLCGSEDDWVKKICKWIVSVQSQGNITLMNQIAESYLLVLGTSIPSWAFRFLWYTLTNPLYRKKTNQMGDTLAARPEPHNPNVRRFITSYDAMIISATETAKFTKSLISRWKESPHYLRFKDSNIINAPDKEHIFVSYLSEDRNNLEEYLIPLLRKLEARSGYKFWYDRQSLHGGDDWDFKINKAIENAQCFIPFLTKKSFELIHTDTARYLRIEWRNALQKSKNLKEKYGEFGTPRFILPITLGGQENAAGNFAAFQSIEITDTNAGDNILSEIEDIISLYRIYTK